MEHKRAKSSLVEYKDKNNLVIGLQYNAPLQRFIATSGWSRLFSGKNGNFEWADYDLKASFSMFDGGFYLGDLRHFFPNLAPFEVVNYRDWHREKPTELTRSVGGKYIPIEEELQSWEIASFDESKGERVAVMITHAPRDDVFTIQYRLNQLINQAKRLTEGFQPELRENYKAGKRAAETNEERQMIAEIQADYAENAPMWDWK